MCINNSPRHKEHGITFRDVAPKWGVLHSVLTTALLNRAETTIDIRQRSILYMYKEQCRNTNRDTIDGMS